MGAKAKPADLTLEEKKTACPTSDIPRLDAPAEGCGCIFYPGAEAATFNYGHDELVSAGNGRIHCVAGILDYVVSCDELDYGAGVVDPSDFMAFAAMHSWADPVGATFFFRSLSELAQLLRDLRTKNDALSGVTDALTAIELTAGMGLKHVERARL